MRNPCENWFYRSIRSLLDKVDRQERVLHSRNKTSKEAEPEVQTQRRQRDEQRIHKRRRSKQRVDWTKKRRTHDHAGCRNTCFDKSTQILQRRKRLLLFSDQTAEGNVLGSEVTNIEAKDHPNSNEKPVKLTVERPLKLILKQRPQDQYKNEGARYRSDQDRNAQPIALQTLDRKFLLEDITGEAYDLLSTQGH